MEDDLTFEELDKYALQLFNKIEFQPEPEVENIYMNNDPGNYDLQNRVESSTFVYDARNMNPSIHFDGAVLTCVLCMQNSTNVSCVGARDMVKHLWEMHQEKLYVCNVCKVQFHHEFELSKHKKIHMPTTSSNKKWECTKCPKKFGSRNLVEEHEYSHAGIRPFQCDLCSKSYATKYTYKAHRKTHEPRIRSFACEICNRSFLTKQNLKQHKETHKEIKDFSCSLCDNRKFTTENNLKSHMLIHGGKKRFPCLFIIADQPCGKIFARKAELKDHERTHTGERPHICTTCGMAFAQRSNLQSHDKATHLNMKNKICKICGQGFKRARLLKYHMHSKHTHERPYKCTQCEKDFVYPAHLKKHIINLHQNEKPFQCNICETSFGSRDNYNSHLFTHTTRNQFECIICRVGFKRKSALKKHMDDLNHQSPTYVFNRLQVQLSSNDDANTKENVWEMIIASEIREIDEVAHRNAQLQNNGYVNQYYSNGTHALLQNPDGSQYVGVIENGEIPQYDYENHSVPFPTNGYSNESNATNMYSNQNILQQLEIQTDEGVQYVLIELLPNQPINSS